VLSKFSKSLNFSLSLVFLGLLDTNSSLAENSDQYFAELHEFRQANKEVCIHEQHLE